ncbi:MAG: hypothetical protein ACOYB3_00270 [Azonexus sp.]
MAQYALDDLTFNFVPDGLPLPDILASENIDQITANDIYRQAYRMIYNDWPKSDLGQKWQAAIANARAAQMDFKTFCLYIIAGYMVTHEHTPFFPVNLTANSSLEKVEGYRKACLRKFGASDARSLGLLLNLEMYDIDEEMLLSEVSFGRYVTGYVISGEKQICRAVYDQDEIAFSPYWLAIEYTYHENVFVPYLQKVKETTVQEKSKLGNPAQLRHRHLVSQVISVLKRRTHLASTIFASRSRIMPKAVKSVLSHHGLKPASPISDSANIDDAYEFWKQVGDACLTERGKLCH